MTFTHADADCLFEDLVVSEGASGSRIYKTPAGQKYPSVTTVTGFKKAQFFAEWRKKNPKESRRVLHRGNVFHQLVEDYLQNKEVRSESIRPDIWMMFEQAKPVLDNINNIHAQEVPLWSSTLQLAGRVDCVAEYNGKLSVIDFKGATREKRASDIGNYFMQASAYAIMYHEMTGIPINNIVILISTEEGTTQVFESNPLKHTKKLYECIQDYKAHLERELKLYR
jgi:genome maintenance exonuclease 1